MGVRWMDKKTLSSIIMEQLTQVGIEYTHGNGTDISIAKEFINAEELDSEKINYEAYLFLDETTQTVYMYEKTIEVGKGFSVGEESEISFQSGAILYRKVKSVQQTNKFKFKTQGYEKDFNFCSSHCNSRIVYTSQGPVSAKGGPQTG